MDTDTANDRDRCLHVYFPHQEAKSFLSKCLRFLCGGQWHVAVGDGDTVFDPFINHKRPWFAAEDYKALFKSGIYYRVNIVLDYGWAYNVHNFKRPRNIFSHLWAVIRRRDCVGLATRILTEKFDTPMFLRPLDIEWFLDNLGDRIVVCGHWRSK